MPLPQPPYPEPMYEMNLSAHGGMDSKQRPWMLDQNKAAYLENLDVERIGSATRREGVTSIGSRTNDSSRGMWRMQDTTLDQEVLFGAFGGGVFAFDGSGTQYQRACGVSLSNTLHMGVEGRYAGRLATYIVQAWQNDSNFSLASGIAVHTDDDQWTQVTAWAPICGAWYQNRMWITDGDQTVLFSELADGVSFSANNSFEVEPGIGGKVTAFLPIFDDSPGLVIFKEAAVCVFHPYWGSSSALIPTAADALDSIKSEIITVAVHTGCVAPLSVQNTPGAPVGEVYFLSAEGVRAVTKSQYKNVDGVSLPISDAIKPIIDRINFQYAHKCVSAYFDNKYHLAVPLDGATENNYVISFDTINQGWYLNTWSPKAFVVATVNDTTKQLWMQYNAQTADCSVTDVTTGYNVFKCFSGREDPDGVPVAWRYDTRGMAFGDLQQKKTWDQVRVTFTNEASYTAVLAICYNIDQKGWVTLASCVMGDMIGGQDPIIGETPLPWGYITGAVRTQKFSLADTDPGYEIQIRVVGGTSDYSQTVVYGVSVGARPCGPEFDNLIG